MRQAVQGPLPDRPKTSRRVFRLRPAPESAGGVCRRPASCSASPRRQRPGRQEATGGNARVLLQSGRDGRRSTLSPLILVTGGERRACRLEFAPLVEDFNPLFRIFQARVAEPRELHAALVEFQRFLKRQLAILELLDDRLEFRDCCFKVLDSGSHNWPLRTSHSNSPSARVTRT